MPPRGSQGMHLRLDARFTPAITLWTIAPRTILNGR